MVVIRQGMVLILLLISGNASAQMVYKCVGKAGAVSYQSAPCPADASQPKAWEATPEPPPTNEELWRRYNERKKGEAESRYLSRLAGTDRMPGASGHIVSQRDSSSNARCEMAKRNREEALERAGLNRTYEYLSRLDEMVREACK
jgi:hypothetical protein